MRKIAFILFHTGESRALMPSMLKMADKHDKYNICIIPVGQAAKSNLPDSLGNFTKIPGFIRDGHGRNDEFQVEFSKECIQEIIELCKDYNTIVLGSPSRIQEQIAQALPTSKQRNIYFDGPADASKLSTFAMCANTFVFTTLSDKKAASDFVNQMNLDKKPEIIAARHGDFDLWINAYKNLTENTKNEIKNKLDVNNSDRVILWAGGYGNNFSVEDQEAIAFKAFIETFKLYKDHYQLRITLHPGIKKTYSQEKLQSIQEIYYLKPLSEAGFSSSELEKVMTSLDTSQVASIALGVFSAGSTVAKQAILIGTRAKNVIPNRSNSEIISGETFKSHALPNNQLALFEGVEDVKTPERLSILLGRWYHKGRRQIDDISYKKATEKLGLPEESTKHAIKRYSS